MQWQALTDVTNARVLAAQLEWAATRPSARDTAFTIVNGDVFRWQCMWGQIAAWLGLEPAPFPDHLMPVEGQLADAVPIWREIARRHGLTSRAGRVIP